MNKYLHSFLTMIFICISFIALAGKVSGKVTDDKGNVLPYASILIKGTSKGTATNNAGSYFLQLNAGTYTIVCQYVGFARVEKMITVTNNDIELNFQLMPQQTTMKDVIVKSGGEDPAYEIIRNAIKKKPEYREPLDSFTCEAYIKTLIKTRKLPKKIFGKKIEDKDRKESGLDSSGKGILYLSESLTKISFKKPDKTKLEVLSGRESGSNGFGFNFPSFINFYNDNVNVFITQFSPRGYVSPIADAAFNFYRFKYLGTFYEEGKAINKIQVIPRRKFEPLFSGTINITEDDWRIHSLELALNKESQLEVLDTLKIKQINVPIGNNVWRTKDQVVYFTFNQFGIDAVGNFLNVYNKYETTPVFNKKYFNNVVIKYDTAVNKKTKAYWDSVRPVQLEPEEAKDYHIKDSMYQYRKDSVFSKTYIDSMRRSQGKVSLKKILWTGYTRSNYDPKKPVRFTWQPLLKNVQYNTVEGAAINVEGTIRKSFIASKRRISLTPHLRYGLSNTHFNAWATLQLLKRSFEYEDDGGTTSRTQWTFAGGKRVSQLNNENPIAPLMNSIYTLFLHENYIKTDENYFASATYNKRFDNDLRIIADLLYEDRLPLNNTTDYSFFKKDKQFTPNYPAEKISQQFARHQAFIASVEFQYQPGQQYIQFPREKVPLGSKYPTFALQYQKGFQDVLGSDVNFDKWKFSVWDDMNFRLLGKLSYRASIGGFINNKQVFIQDYQHFNGNQLIFASRYLNSFQLAPYYANSTTASFYTTLNAEHHFNGLFTNKIPLFRRLNWNLVAGSNAFFVNKNNNYVEVFAGLENILKVFRVDVVASYLNGKNGQVGIRIGLGGLLGSAIRFN
ncbi:MAG TPA: DUF5686 and carboxypeptidase regulatory-like domain-containing protein [Panacibacter sp.]|nr:DUF5686 and carboxypeptidase regulatory-like domain-containing protein [Panacibacter sp.]